MKVKSQVGSVFLIYTMLSVDTTLFSGLRTYSVGLRIPFDGWISNLIKITCISLFMESHLFNKGAPRRERFPRLRIKSSVAFSVARETLV